MPRASVHFEHWQVCIDLDEIDEEGETVPLEERIWVTGQMRDSEPEIAPKEVLSLVADGLAERLAREAKRGNPQAQE